jgi:hypothetical protein
MSGHDERDPLSNLIRATTGGYPQGLNLDGLAQVESGFAYLEGTTASLPSPQFLVTAAGLALPVGAVSTPMDYTEVYITLSEYLGDLPQVASDGRSNAEIFGDQLIGSFKRESMVLYLCMLNAITGRPVPTETVLKDLRAVLTSEARTRLDGSLKSAAPRHQLLARQPILAALLRTVAHSPVSDSMLNLPPLVAAAILSHAIGVDLTWDDAMNETDETFGGFPERVAADLISNQAFYDSDDIVFILDRNHRLWRDYEGQAAQKMGGRTPTDLLVEACGLEIEDFFAYGFALLAYPLGWEMGKPFGMYSDFGGDTNHHKKQTFTRIISRTVDQLVERVLSDPPHSDWDFIALKESPVIYFPNTSPPLGTLIVSDMAFLLQKITIGLYWIVHDFVRDNKGDTARNQWTQAWGAAVEAMVEDDLRALAPTLLGSGRTFFTEEDLQTLYPGKQNADVVIDYGSHFAVIEIVSGRLHSETVNGRSPDRLRSDMEKIVFKKVRQLDATVEFLSTDSRPLVGDSTLPRWIQPVVVAGGGFPLSPITSAAIDEYCNELSLFKQKRVLPLAVVTLDEVEMLEGLADHIGSHLCDLIGKWKGSSLANMSFRNWLLERFGRGMLIYRPERMKPRFDELTHMMLSRLDLREH